MKDYVTMEANDDVIGLLRSLKELAFTTLKVQYGHWTMCQSLRKMLMMHQQDCEILTVMKSHPVNHLPCPWGVGKPDGAVENIRWSHTTHNEQHDPTGVCWTNVQSKEIWRLVITNEHCQWALLVSITDEHDWWVHTCRTQRLIKHWRATKKRLQVESLLGSNVSREPTGL